MTTDSYQMELSPQQFQVQGELAARTRVSREQVLASAIEQLCLSVAQHVVAENPTPSLAERMRNSGLLGCLNGPADLSTNPAYFEGFGRD